MVIDTNFDFHSDAGGGDPDRTSPTLRRYHKLLWSKPLPNGKMFDLHDDKTGAYLYHQSELGEFMLGSDAIVHSYGDHKRKQWLVQQIRDEVTELFKLGCTIAGYTIFPSKRIEGKLTINGARGCIRLIDDRFDLTLECIRRHYLGLSNPLQDVFLRNKKFFDLFGDFVGYVRFFLLDDLIDGNYRVKFFLPFDDFKSPPNFSGIEEYRKYKRGVIEFVQSRKKRIENYARSVDDNLAEETSTAPSTTAMIHELSTTSARNGLRAEGF